jgi:membrane protease YdiL (CAAX protease family)
MVTPTNIIAAIFTLIPLFAAAFFARSVAGSARRLPGWAQILLPAALSLPYVLVTLAAGQFRWRWFALYALLPVGVAAVERQALLADSRVAPESVSGVNSGPRADIRDFFVLAVLGLAVDLRWFEGAWPPHLAIFSKMILVDTGLYGFVALRNLPGTGFDLRVRFRDLGVGLREVALYTPPALVLGLSLGFLHFHKGWPGLAPIAGAWFFTFFFIAVPEELFFRGWMQNLLESRIGRTPALLVTSALFGLAHFNKRTAFFNWRYVLLAAIAGFFYGRAWRADRRVAASAITHATVDTIWSMWLR